MGVEKKLSSGDAGRKIDAFDCLSVANILLRMYACA